MPTGISSMKILHMRMLISLLCFVVHGGLEPTRAARLLLQKNDLLFVDSGNPSAFDSDLKVALAAADTSAGDKTGLPWEEAEMKPCRGSPDNNDYTQSTLRFKENRTVDVGKKEYEVVYNVLGMGKVPPSGASSRANIIINGQRLSRSKPSPAVGHIQIYDRAKSRQSGGMGNMQKQQSASKKRALNSTPSPGAGH